MIVDRMSLAPQYIDKERFDLELVTCSGRGKNGALCVLQRGVRPQVLGTFHLSGKRAMWTVHARKSAGMLAALVGKSCCVKIFPPQAGCRLLSICRLPCVVCSC
jgi:hypothetical protein